MTPPTEDPPVEAEAPNEAVVPTEDMEQTEDAAAMRTRGERLAEQRPLL
jgi:hypothetical protein